MAKSQLTSLSDNLPLISSRENSNEFGSAF